MTRRTHTRRGMTLVELLVAAAMSIMVMWLLTWCYQQGLGSFSNTKSQGDLMDQLRQVSSLMTRDLTASHFEPDDTRANLGLRVSDQGIVGGSTNYTPPHGYFTAMSKTYTVNEGSDGYGFQSTYSTGHSVQFTALLPGGPPQNLFCADLTGASGSTPQAYYGRAAEIAYFLDSTPTGATPGGTPLYNLRRRQRVCGINSDDAAAYDLSGAPSNTSDVMSTAGSSPSWTVLPLRQLSVSGNPSNNRLVQASLSGARVGEDILMSNVVSLEIKFTGSAQNGTTWPTPYANSSGTITNTDYPYDNLPGTGVFDTAGPQYVSSMTPIRITGAMIRIRAYAPRTQITRQTTFIVSL
ncbi:PulJ/GspJ family protein [Frigoriglobus tundricola]|uniref:Prepilin-type N-terminal cleavage/methylation domain-containing protein n=1 Tax=Frigoriglobus tundricola TaxID=2774151 RepID=A0A6M5YUA4_9BACT|nr:hypothetical protein [Frigoriglobus tundricola]QJW97479.1 hypothetical protein FTUN_5053 [Frigoriglobus tundricola]